MNINRAVKIVLPFLAALIAALFLLSGCSAPTKKAPEPESGKYCVLGVDGERTYPEYTALKFDFDTMGFDFGFAHTLDSWNRVGTLAVDGSRITAVCTSKHKTEFVGDELKQVGDYVWVFELQDDGTLRFLPDESDVYEVYGTQLTAESVLVRVGGLDGPLEWHMTPRPEADGN